MGRSFFLVMLYFFVGISLSAFAQSDGLFEPVEGERVARTAGELDPTIVRSRPVQIVATELPRTDWRPGDWVILNFFDDVELVVELVKLVKRDTSDYTWYGELANDGGEMHLSVKDDVVVANVRGDEKGSFQIRKTGDTLYEVREIDESQFPLCGTSTEHTKHFAPSPFRQAESRDTGKVIDVMVVYTPSVRAAAGGTAATQAMINLAVDETNTAFSNSLINAELRLVHQQEIAYSEGSSQTSFEDALLNLTGKNDGFMDEVHALRDLYGADNVSLLVKNSSLCGLAWIMGTPTVAFESAAFSVVHYSCAAGGYTLAHELGHNWGCSHDRAVSNGGGSFSYSFGYNFFGNSGQRFKTIMSYGGGTRLAQYSTPLITIDGVLAGIAEGQANSADNARSINNAVSSIINWRQTSNAMVVSPEAAFVTSGGAGGPFTPGCTTYTLTNTGDTVINWTVSKTQSWVSASPGGGTLGVGASTNVNVCVTSTANGLAVGPHNATVTFTNTTEGELEQRVAELTVTPPQIVLFDFDTDPGWTAQGDWAFGTPTGGGSNGGDPTSGFTGNKVYGFNLAGNYSNNMSETSLTTAAINCAGFSNVSLTFYRWLGVESSQWDDAKVQVSNNGSTWSDVWNHNGGSFNDGAWVQQNFDVSSVADGQSTVFVRWVMGTTDGSVTFPGWNIDDVLLTGTPLAGPEVWVDFAHGGTQHGTPSLPFRTLLGAVNVVDSGGVIKIKGNTGDNTSNESLIINRPVTLEAMNGPVRIGTP